jgi:hypothetical protein
MHAPNSWLVEEPDGKSVFNSTYVIYVSFFSKEDQFIHVSVTFVDKNKFRQEQAKKRQQMKKSRI